MTYKEMVDKVEFLEGMVLRLSEKVISLKAIIEGPVNIDSKSPPGGKTSYRITPFVEKG